MRTQRGIFSIALGLVAMVSLVVACSSDDAPTRPEPGNNPGNGGGGGGTTFSISVSSSASELPIGSGEPARITVAVRRTDNNQVPPNGAVVNLTTNFGDFGNANSGLRASSLTLINGQASLTLFPAAVTGQAVIQARIENSLGEVRVNFVEEATFNASFLEPNTGVPAGNERVFVRGQGFQAPVRVEFLVAGAIAATAQVLSVTSAAVEILTPASGVGVPVGSTLTADVRITNQAGSPEQQVQNLPGSFVYSLGGSVLQPVISGVTPNQGPNEGGTLLRIRGDGFESPVQVLFGNGATPAGFQGLEGVVQDVSRTELMVVTPSATGVGQDNRNSFVNILVRNQVSGFTTISENAFQYGQSNVFISSISPGIGSHTGGTSVVISGSGFDEPVAVNFAGVGASATNVSGSQIIARTGGVIIDSCSNVTGPTTVVNLETGDGATGPDFTYQVLLPVIEAVDPTTVGEDGGDQIAITGFGFEEPVQVLIGGRIGSEPQIILTADGKQRILVNAPPFVGVFPMETCTVNEQGTTINGMSPRNVTADLKVVNLLTTCEAEIADQIIYEPSSSDCVPNPPTAAFTFSVSGTTISTNNTSTNAAESRWLFRADGLPDRTFTERSPTVTYTVPAGETQPVSIQLVVTNSIGMDDDQLNTELSGPAAPPPP